MKQPVKWIFDTRPIDTPYLSLVEDTTTVAEKQETFFERHQALITMLLMMILCGLLG